MIRAGRMDQRVEFLQTTKTADSQGGNAYAWSIYATRWAEIKTIRAIEQFKAGQVDNPTTQILICRDFDGVTADMRVRYGRELYKITGITNPAAGELEITIEKIIGENTDLT